ncbi:hypothetical protein BH23ACT9_BH23ACT9_21960 [soil metagenome]
MLLVANQTLGSPAVRAAMQERKASHDRVTAFVLVPATPSEHLDPALSGSPVPAQPGPEAGTDDAGLAHARWRLRTALTALEGLGIVAHGRVGDANPLKAVADVIATEPIDEILLSTLDPQTSRWLRLDLPQALQRRYKLPVTALTPRAHQPTSS